MTWLASEAGAGAHIPLDTGGAIAQIPHLHVDAGLNRHKIRRLTEVDNTVLALDRVVGLTAVEPMAVHADAHAAAAMPGPHCAGPG